MTTFNLNDRVWYRRHPHSASLPAAVVKVCQLPGLYDVNYGPETVVACTEQLSHRSENDRVEGLGQLRARMQTENVEQIRQDADLLPEELRGKYDTPDGWGEHPGYPMADWRYDVASEVTRSGYWDWVIYKLNE